MSDDTRACEALRQIVEVCQHAGYPWPEGSTVTPGRAYTLGLIEGLARRALAEPLAQRKPTP